MNKEKEFEVGDLLEICDESERGAEYSYFIVLEKYYHNNLYSELEVRYDLFNFKYGFIHTSIRGILFRKVVKKAK